MKGAPWLTDLAARSSFGAAFASSADHRRTRRVSDQSCTRFRGRSGRFVRRLVADQLGLILRSSVDPDRPITDYGLIPLATWSYVPVSRAKRASGSGRRTSRPYEAWPMLFADP